MADLLHTIDSWGENGRRREDLRVLALLHDALKFKVDHLRRRTGENHHAMRSRRFAERYLADERLLCALELHDRPYGIWRKLQRAGRFDSERFDEMLERIDDLPLFVRFIELDGSTEGKDPEPVEWFRNELDRRGAR